MVRKKQFLIPWLLLAELLQINCQPPPPQPPGFDHVQGDTNKLQPLLLRKENNKIAIFLTSRKLSYHFQHLFTHPAIPQSHPFGIDGFRALHNQPPVIHPHYEFLAPQNGGQMVNPNFIHPHPFFHLHHPHFASTTLLPRPTTTVKPETPSTTQSTVQTTQSTTPTTQPSTTTQVSTTTTPAEIKVESTRVPQASKPVVESVRTYSPESEQKVTDLTALEKVEPLKVEKKVQNFATPSSTVLPTAQLIQNQTVEVVSTSIVPTTQPTTIQSTTTQQVTTQPTTIQSTTIQPETTQPPITVATTNLPEKISKEAERAEKNGEKLDLIKHLNTSDLETFLKSANLSTHEAQNFLRLVEKVLEEELQKRLHKQKESTPVEQNRPLSNQNVSASIKPVSLNAETLSGEGHEVKTVETRLSYESSEIDQTTNSKVFTSTQTSGRVAAYSQHSALEVNSAGKSNAKFASLDEIREREQAEFDRLLGQLVLKGDSKEENNEEEEVDQNEDDDLLGPSTAAPAIQSPPRNHYNRPSIRHPPKTTFEQLAQDYQYRLSGHNGFNDLIKALRNAHIGFFDRTKKKIRHRIN